MVRASPRPEARAETTQKTSIFKVFWELDIVLRDLSEACKVFWELDRVLRDLSEACKNKDKDLRVCFVVENVMMDEKPEKTITDKLGCRQTSQNQRRPGVHSKP